MTSSTATAPADDGRVLLPADVEPLEYDIKLIPDLQKFSFDGEQTITVEVKSETSSICMHTKEIYIKETSFTGSDGKSVSPVSMAFDLKLTTVTFAFAEPLPLGRGTIAMKFEGCLNDQMAGFYRSGYKDIKGADKVMASTQFEALDARRCFPCWDEPQRKAVFKMTLVVEKSLTAFSNMPESESHELANGTHREITFMPTPIMSTYLLAFCVGEFDFVQGVTEHGVSIRVYTPPGRSHLGTFALSVATQTLDLYDDFFRVPYPLPKLDMVAIPAFAMGAMENWGLVTYREVDLLVDEKKASSQQRQRVCTVITHELAHQWFGNLVTMAWWCDLWLNEGFACWTQTYAADKLYPSWSMWEQFVTSDQAAALRLDSLRSSHPIQVPIAHAEEVEQVFDAISYCKGACVVRMLYAVLGQEHFQKGLQVYMDRHKYGNTETIDLWKAWADVSGKPILELMAGWTEQMGHPVVAVVGEKRTGSSVTLELEQSWFLADGSAVSKEEEKVWTIPVFAASPATKEPIMQLMSSKTISLTVPLSEEGNWVKLNAGQHVLMRVLYTPSMMSRLQEAVAAKTLTAEDRAGLLSDAYALAKAGKMDVPTLVKLLPAYAQEENSTVWEMIEGVLLGMDKLLQEKPDIQKNFRVLGTKLIAARAGSIGWEPKEDDGHLGKLLRGTMVELMCHFSYEEPAVLDEVKTRFDAHYHDPQNVVVLPAEYTVPVYKVILKTGGVEEYEKLMTIFKRAETNVDRKMVYSSIGAASTVALKQKVLDWAMDEIVLQDFFYPMASVAGSSKEGLELAWKFFQENFEKLKTKLVSSSPSIMHAVISYCCGGFADEGRVKEVEDFFKAHPVPNAERKIAQLLENMRINTAFLTAAAQSSLNTSEFWESLSL